MSGRNAGLQALVRKKAPHCMLHRGARVTRNVSEELQTAFEALIRVVNYVKNSPLRGTLFATLYEDMEAEHTALLYCC